MHGRQQLSCACCWRNHTAAPIWPQEMDAEGRVLVTDHSSFVLFNLYGKYGLEPLAAARLAVLQPPVPRRRGSMVCGPLTGLQFPAVQAQPSPMRTQPRTAPSSSCASTGCVLVNSLPVGGLPC